MKIIKILVRDDSGVWYNLLHSILDGLVFFRSTDKGKFYIAKRPYSKDDPYPSSGVMKKTDLLNDRFVIEKVFYTAISLSIVSKPDKINRSYVTEIIDLHDVRSLATWQFQPFILSNKEDEITVLDIEVKQIIPLSDNSYII